MEKIYWISVIGNLQIVLFVIGIILVVFLLFLFMEGLMDSEDENVKKRKEYKTTTIVLVLFTSLSLIFIPTQKQMYAIYGIGGTIDYIENNDKAKELPNKVIDALDLYLDGKTNK